MRIGKLGICIGKSQYTKELRVRYGHKPWLAIIRQRYYGTKGGELIIHFFNVFINLSWLGQIYKLSTEQ